MIRNYFKIALRNLRKYKFISFINLFGLTVGIACCLLILTYILHELSFDKQHTKADNIYRLSRLFRNPQTKETSLHLGTLAPPFGPLLKNDFKEIQQVTVLLDNSPSPLRYEDKIFNEENVFFADEHLFDVFDFKVLKGNPAKALSDPYTIMITEEVAQKYFGNQDPMNKIIRLDSRFNLKVAGVYKALPSNSHMHPAVLISFNTLKDTAVYGEENLRTNWGNNSFYTYILTGSNFNQKNLEAQFPAFLDKHMGNKESKIKPSSWTALYLHKLTDIHLRSHLDTEVEENGDIRRIYIFGAIGFFILLIACINYMNLSTARSALRAKEIGIRKTVGAERKEIMLQFLSESVMIAWVAMILAIILTQISMPWLNKISGQQLSIRALLQPGIIAILLVIPFVVGIISGIYPALFMSSFNPVKVLKGLVSVGGNNISFRKVLVTLQFAISIILIISTAVVYRQLQYMQKKSLGFDRDHIVTIGYNGALNDKFESFRNDLVANNHIKNVTRSSRIPTGRLLDAQGTQINRGDSLEPSNVDIKYVSTDENFLSTFAVKMTAGRDFSKTYGTDTSSFLINEASVKALGLPSNQAAINKQIVYGNRKGKVIGVIGDFHFESMHQKIVPLILMVPQNQFEYGRISIKIAGTDLPIALAHIEKVWKRFLPEFAFEYNFLDENFARLYQSETRQGNIFTIFSCIAIFIACLGLFGLSAFAITQRVKEIGIRKILGASTGNLVGLLSKDFLQLVVIASIIAFPIAWYAMNNWLNDFAYRSSIPWWLFLGSGIVAAIVALATISFQAIKAALANPVKNLRTE